MLTDKDNDKDRDLEQAKLYARDFGELYRAEKKRREELAEEKIVLEQKLRELEALNKLFQSHLSQRFEVQETYDDLVEKLKTLLQGGMNAETWSKLKELLKEAEAKQSQTPQQPPEQGNSSNP